MSVPSTDNPKLSLFAGANWQGLFWLAVALVGTTVFFWEGLVTLVNAWQVPEYSHGPLIPVLSGLLFLRQLKSFPIEIGVPKQRWQGVALMIMSLLFAAIGIVSGIGDFVAYGLILWTGALLLISFGWKTGKHFWPPVLHLVYMLPLPGVFYFKLSHSLQLISSEFGVWILGLLSVPVFLEGNIIDLGVYQLHVAEACSGLRYLFPILSFSYIFAVLYQGPMWHKAVLLLSAAPITVAMNSVRIGLVGWLVNHYGIEQAEGLGHLLEGWVIFIACVLILFALAWVMMRLQRTKLTLVEALDLDTEGLGTQFMRIRLIEPSAALIVSALMVAGAAAIWQSVPERAQLVVERSQFAQFPARLGDWRAGGQIEIGERIERTLGADDILASTYRHPDHEADVDVFIAWYQDQSKGGVHSPEICIPGAGWEMAGLRAFDGTERFDTNVPFKLNRAVIQKGRERLLVYYWFEQHGRKIAWDYAAKFNLIWDGVLYGRTDGALVRFITPIGEDENDAAAEARLDEFVKDILPVMPEYLPAEPRLLPPEV